MKNQKKLLLYILLNVIISAITIVIVLYFWEKAHTPETNPVISSTQESQNTNLSPMPETKITGINENAEISIEGIFGIGQNDIEHVSIRNTGDISIDLSYCRLRNGRGDEYLFPDITLNQGGAVSIFSKAGNNTVLELYWGRSDSLWKSGDLANLLDQNGNILSTYQIP